MAAPPITEREKKRMPSEVQTWIEVSRRWLEGIADDATVPKWLRILFVALSRCDETGVAVLEPGELEAHLGSSRGNTQRMVRECVAVNLLAEGSTLERLIMPDMEGTK